MLIVGFWYLFAGSFNILNGSVKIWKHSARLSLAMIKRLKRIVSLAILALVFWPFLVLVRDRSPWWYPWWVGFSLGGIFLILSNASLAQASGFTQFFSLSDQYGWHWQYADCWCGSSRFGSRILMAIFISLATVQVRCFSISHFAAFVLIALGSAVRWYHVGSWALRLGVSWIAARLVLYFLATFIIL
jgi:hypothetical protein